VALAALEKLVARGTIPKNSDVVVISTAHGLKFPDFKVGYHQGDLPEVKSAYPNPPVELPARADAIMAALDARVPRP
jgi:threonine synthase